MHYSGEDNVISEKEMPGGVVFDPKNLLLNESAHIARLDLNITSAELKELPILPLTADIKGTEEKAYFAPVSYTHLFSSLWG